MLYLAAIIPPWYNGRQEGAAVEIQNLRIITRFQKQYPDSRASLSRWIHVAQRARWSNPAEVRQTFASTSFVRSAIIFNIAGNRYRLWTEIDYMAQTITIITIGPHSEYDRWPL